MCLAQAEGFDLDEMWGFGGDRPSSEVSTVLEPLLDHPDVGGDDLSPFSCVVMLPRLEAITGEWAQRSDDPLLHQHIEEACRLADVVRFCLEGQVSLLFC
ncbi:hypothetical protein OHB36_36255 [Streptomyces sp. NBC_00320]|uniref:hypothetical protein n=1 Tax=Streptomyces sp. NBC_00320 TaxID=2975711 RepID=UPI002257213B|nr:hypothetical protein [Streptomyces sp. NBC_00320]MCX5152127.1 hypothetical protein [Streptomyces sp. NBC_00320]